MKILNQNKSKTNEDLGFHEINEVILDKFHKGIQSKDALREVKTILEELTFPGFSRKNKNYIILYIKGMGLLMDAFLKPDLSVVGESVNLFKKTIKLNSNFSYAHFFLGQALRIQSDLVPESESTAIRHKADNAIQASCELNPEVRKYYSICR